MDNAAQHFAGRTSSGLYEDRDEDATRGGCYCKPLNLPGSYEEPRSRVLYNALAALGGLRGVDDGRPSSRGAGISWVATRADPRGLREAVFTDLLSGAKIVGTPRAIRITTRDGDVLPAFHWIALGS